MIPLKDHNPTSRLAVLTAVIIALCSAIYFFVQQPANSMRVDVVQDTSGRQVQIDGELRFNLEWAAVPCEIVERRPLTVEEIRQTFQFGDDTSCDGNGRGAQLFGDKNVWLALVVSMFLHGNLLHLGGNMLYLWVFGNNIEDRLGRVRFVFFYLGAGLFASVAHVLVQPDSTVPVVGASGAIAGVMGAYLVWYPRTRILSIVPIFLFGFLHEIEARWLLAIWFVLQFFTNPNSGVAWVAHVGGFVFGVVFALAARGPTRARPILRSR